jgi:hypothetical protein
MLLVNFPGYYLCNSLEEVMMAKKLEGKLNEFRGCIKFISLGVVVVGGILLLQPPLRPLAFLSIGGATAAYLTANLTRKIDLAIVQTHLDAVTSQYEEKLRQKDNEIIRLNVLNSELSDDLANLRCNDLIVKNLVKSLQGQIYNLEKSKVIMSQEIQKISAKNEELINAEYRLVQSAKELVQEALEDWQQRVSELVKFKEMLNPSLASKMNEPLKEAQTYFEIYSAQLKEKGSELDDFQDIFLTLHNLNSDLVNVKVKMINSLSAYRQQEREGAIAQLEPSKISRQVKAICPDCGTPSGRKGKATGRYYCNNPACSRKTFTWKGLHCF